MKLSIIVAASENNVIGRGGDLPWRLSADLRRFKRLTMGHCLIMGRKTYESIGRPLTGRVSIVISRTKKQGESKSPSPGTGEGLGEGAVPEQILLATSLDEACDLVLTTSMSYEEAFVTGGGEIYRLALPHADRLFVTRVHTEIDGDATFPKLDPTDWHLVESQSHAADEKNEFDVTFEVWERTANQANLRE